MKKAAIWDMDGVIVDTGPYHLRAWQRFWRELGRPFEARDFQRTFGQRNDRVISVYLGKEISSAEIDDLSQRKERYFREEIGDEVRAMPGVMELLRGLADAGYVQGLATSAPRVNAEFILDRLAAHRCFAAVIAAEDVRHGKPDPEIFLLAANALRVPRGSCVVFEDSIAGIHAAKSAGMICVATTTTSPREDLTAADMVVAGFTGMTPALVDGLLTRKD